MDRFPPAVTSISFKFPFVDTWISALLLLLVTFRAPTSREPAVMDRLPPPVTPISCRLSPLAALKSPSALIVTVPPQLSSEPMDMEPPFILVSAYEPPVRNPSIVTDWVVSPPIDIFPPQLAVDIGYPFASGY